VLKQATLGSGGVACAPRPTALIAVKPGELRPSRLTELPRRRRAVVAGIAAAGLGLTAALYPLPRDLNLLDLFPPGDHSTQVSSRVVFEPGDFPALAAFEQTTFDGAKLSDLVDLSELLSNYPDLPVGTLLDIVQTYGLPGAVTLLRSVLPSQPGYPGGGFGLVSSGGGNTSALPVLMQLLEYLKHAPTASIGALSAVVTKVLPAVLRSVGIPLPPATPAAPARVSAAAEATPPAPAVAPDPGPSRLISSPAPEPPAPAPTAEPVSAPAPDPAPQPAQPQVSPVAEATQAASAITNNGLLSSESSLNNRGIADVPGGLDGISAGGPSESRTGGAGSGESPSINADPERVGPADGVTTGGGGAGDGQSTGDGSGGG
jgi:hypothetical protein